MKKILAIASIAIGTASLGAPHIAFAQAAGSAAGSAAAGGPAGTLSTKSTDAPKPAENNTRPKPSNTDAGAAAGAK